MTTEFMAGQFMAGRLVHADVLRYAYNEVANHLNQYLGIDPLSWEGMDGFFYDDTVKSSIIRFVNDPSRNEIVVPYGSDPLRDRKAAHVYTSQGEPDKWFVVYGSMWDKVNSWKEESSWVTSPFSDSPIVTKVPKMIPSLQLNSQTLPFIADIKNFPTKPLPYSYRNDRWRNRKTECNGYALAQYRMLKELFEQQAETVLPELDLSRINSETLYEFLRITHRQKNSSDYSCLLPTVGYFTNLRISLVDGWMQVAQQDKVGAAQQKVLAKLNPLSEIAAVVGVAVEPEIPELDKRLPEHIVEKLSTIYRLRSRLNADYLDVTQKYTIDRMDDEMKGLSNLLTSYLQLSDDTELPSHVEEILDLTAKELNGIIQAVQAQMMRQLETQKLFMQDRNSDMQASS